MLCTTEKYINMRDASGLLLCTQMQNKSCLLMSTCEAATKFRPEQF